MDLDIGASESHIIAFVACTAIWLSRIATAYDHSDLCADRTRLGLGDTCAIFGLSARLCVS